MRLPHPLQKGSTKLREKNRETTTPDRKITVDCPFKSTPYSSTVNSPDHGYVAEHNGMGNPLDSINHRPGLCLIVRVLMVLLVVPGAKRATRPGEDDGSGFCIRIGTKRHFRRIAQVFRNTFSRPKGTEKR